MTRPMFQASTTLCRAAPPGSPLSLSLPPPTHIPVLPILCPMCHKNVYASLPPTSQPMLKFSKLFPHLLIVAAGNVSPRPATINNAQFCAESFSHNVECFPGLRPRRGIAGPKGMTTFLWLRWVFPHGSTIGLTMAQRDL